jgi:hypothetical protein
MHASRLLAFAALGALVAGCSGGGGGSLPVARSASGHSTATIRIAIPGSSAQGTSRRPAWVSHSSNGILVQIYDHADTGHTTVLDSSTNDISSGSPACGGTTGTPRTCTIVVPAPPGHQDIVFTDYDAAPIAGSFGGAHAVGIGMTTTTINEAATNVVSVTLNGVVNAIALSLNPTSFASGSPNSGILNVTATDAGNNTIVTDSFVDANGQPLTITIGAASTPSNASGHVTLGATTISAPTAGIAVSYDGDASVTSVTFTPQPSSAIAGTATGATLTIP